MTVPYAVHDNRHDGEDVESLPERPVKRAKTAGPPKTHLLDAKDDATLVRRHPLGVRPSGNALTSNVNLKHSAGHFAALPDELIAQILDIFQPRDLLRLGGTCRALHAFTRNEEVWRTLFVE